VNFEDFFMFTGVSFAGKDRYKIHIAQAWIEAIRGERRTFQVKGNNPSRYFLIDTSVRTREVRPWDESHLLPAQPGRGYN
jgi:hypothetical protein